MNYAVHNVMKVDKQSIKKTMEFYKLQVGKV